MGIKDQQQSAEDGSTAIQAQGNVTVVHVHGLSVQEVRSIALDVFNANLMELRGKAAKTAADRGEEITDKFLGKLQEENPEGLNEAESPDFQDALFTVQKEYAKAGDKDLGDLLVRMLVDRSKLPKRDLQQLVINEALHVAPKQTNEEVNTLAVIFITVNTRNLRVRDWESFGKLVNQLYVPLIHQMVSTQSHFAHMAAVGAGLILQFAGNTLEQNFLERYTFLFMNGFTAQELPDMDFSMKTPEGDPVFMPSLNDPSKFQLTAANLEVATKMFSSLPDDKKTRLMGIFNSNQMPLEQVKAAILKNAPALDPLFQYWSRFVIGRFNLSSIGIAIAHAKVRGIDPAAGELAHFLT